MTTGLFTDQYELTMLEAALHDGTADRRSVFEVFGRRLPDGRRYGVVAGIDRVLEAISDFRFDDKSLSYLSENHILDAGTIDWLANYRFGGDIWGYPDGEAFFPGSPLLVVEGGFGEAVVLETIALSILNHDSAIASAASRMVTAAGGRPCIEMGSRRTHEWAAVAAAHAAYIAGFTATSNLEAGRVHGIPTVGTSAHSFTLLHDSERDAFTSQVEALGSGTTLLVDTYDIEAAVRTAVEVAGPDLGAVRIDSGDLPSLASQVRKQLDDLGATKTRIIVTSDLDEYAIAALAATPADGYGVGTSLVTGSGHPTCGFVYKLVARETADGSLIGVEKKSKNKRSVGGRKYAWRRIGPHHGLATHELIGVGADLPPNNARELLVPLVRSGERVHRESLDAVRDRSRRSLDELPPQARQLSHGDPAIETIYVKEDR